MVVLAARLIELVQASRLHYETSRYMDLKSALAADQRLQRLRCGRDPAGVRRFMIG
jgi:hypothetical protein